MKYITQLNVHSDYELGQSLIKIDDYIDFAKKNNLKAISLTDDSTLSGVVEFYKKAAVNGIKPIIGAEFNICKNNAESRREKTLSEILLYAKNNEGFENLIQLSNYANTKGNYKQFKIDMDILQKYSKGLICVTYELLPNKTNTQLTEQIKKYKYIFGEDLYIGLNEDEINVRNEQFIDLINIAKQFNIKPVITSEVRYFDSEEFQKFYELYKENLEKERPNKKYFLGYFHYRSFDELRKIYHFLNDKQFNKYISNIDEIIQKCNIDLEKFYDFSKLPKYGTPKGYSPQEYLEELVKKGITERYPKITDEIKNRYEYELKIIKQKNFADYFLTVWDYVNYAIENDIPYGIGRGYAPCSIVCYALKITHINPLENNLYFERFLNPNENSYPNIDIDFGHPEINKLVSYINQKYKNQTAKILTYGTYSPVAAFMLACKFNDIPHSECKKFCKIIKKENANSLNSIIKNEDSIFKKLCDENYVLTSLSGENVELKKVVEDSLIYEGLKCNSTTHVAGIIISHEDLGNRIPVTCDMRGKITAQYTKEALETLGYVKFDIIPSAYISFFNNIANEAGVNLSKIPLDDNKTFEDIKNGETKDTYALCSDHCISYLKKLKPDNIKQLCTFISLYREKPVRNGLMKEYIERKNGKVFEYPHPLLKPILEETFGILVYEEQVIEIIKLLTKCTLAEADIVRNDIRQGVFDTEALTVTLIKNGFNKTTANRITKLLLKNGAFAYSKSHATGLAWQNYYQAYLKAHYPECFSENN